MLERYRQVVVEVDALRAYARMLHHLAPAHLEPWLAEDFHYSSDWVREVLTTKQAYLDYIEPKIENIKRTGIRVWAELAWSGSRPCLLMAQGRQEDVIALLMVEMHAGRVGRAQLCAVPTVLPIRRTGEYPV